MCGPQVRLPIQLSLIHIFPSNEDASEEKLLTSIKYKVRCKVLPEKSIFPDTGKVLHPPPAHIIAKNNMINLNSIVRYLQVKFTLYKGDIKDSFL